MPLKEAYYLTYDIITVRIIYDGVRGVWTNQQVSLVLERLLALSVQCLSEIIHVLLFLSLNESKN